MMRTIVALFSLLLLNCQKAADKPEIKDEVQKTESSQTEKGATHKSNPDCEEFFKKILLSSNLAALKNYKDIFIRIEDVSDDKIVLEVYVKNTDSDSPTGTRITENTVAWLHFLPANDKLLDITSDPEDPMVLSFDKNILKESEYRNICGLSEKELQNKVFVKADVLCKEIKGTMLRGEECLISGASLEQVYEEMVQKSLVKDAQFLLKKNPKIATTQKINKNGIIDIKYMPGNNKIDIEMFYEGGITDIHLVKKGQNVKRQIIYNLD